MLKDDHLNMPVGRYRHEIVRKMKNKNTENKVNGCCEQGHGKGILKKKMADDRRRSRGTIDELLASGTDEPWSTWRNLNPLRVQKGRCRAMVNMWKLSLIQMYVTVGKDRLEVYVSSYDM